MGLKTHFLTHFPCHEQKEEAGPASSISKAQGLLPGDGGTWPYGIGVPREACL